MKFNNVNQGESQWTLLSVWVFQTTQLTEISCIEWKHPFQQENNQSWFPVGDNKKVSFLIPLFYFPLGHILIGIQPTCQLCCLSRVIWSFQVTLPEWEGFEVRPVFIADEGLWAMRRQQWFVSQPRGLWVWSPGLGPFCVELAFSLWVIRLPPAFQKYAHETIWKL